MRNEIRFSASLIFVEISSSGVAWAGLEAFELLDILLTMLQLMI